ncbi:hypothetical protein GJ496_004174 [Pomphorhynchus laevis]|nr:hypothetical protein GJ496_004174 [Pomphorhynchus laevis]
MTDLGGGRTVSKEKIKFECEEVNTQGIEGLSDCLWTSTDYPIIQIPLIVYNGRDIRDFRDGVWNHQRKKSIGDSASPCCTFSDDSKGLN